MAYISQKRRGKQMTRKELMEHNAKAEREQRIVETIQDFAALFGVVCWGVVMVLLAVAFGAY